MKPRFLINCDDLGMHETVNEAITDILSQGVIRSTSLMATGQAYQDAVDRLRDTGIDRCGVHLVLNSEYPVLPGRPLLGCEVPSLTNDSGEFHADPLVSREQASPDEVRREWRAQIRRVQESGLEISHLDSHMFCSDEAVAGEAISAVAMELADEMDLPLRRLNPEGDLPGPQTRFIWDGYDDTASRSAWYDQLLGKATQRRQEIILHPARDPAQLKKFTHSGERRVADYRFFSSDAFLARARSGEFAVVDWRGLSEHQRA